MTAAYFLGFRSRKFPEGTNETAADLEGLTVMEEILLQQEIEWIKRRAWRRLDAFALLICSVLFGLLRCYLWQMPEKGRLTVAPKRK